MKNIVIHEKLDNGKKGNERIHIKKIKYFIN